MPLNGARRRKRRRSVDEAYIWLKSKRRPPEASDIARIVRAIRAGQIEGEALRAKVSLLKWALQSDNSSPRARMLAAQCLIDLEAKGQ